jgi:UDP-glucose 4-epimerase
MAAALVTGGAGFVGSHVADALLRMGMKVTVIDDLSQGFWRNVPEGCEFRRISVNDAHAIDALFERRRFRYVYHLAAYAAEGMSHFIRAFNYSNNLIGSVNLINASVRHGVDRFVFASSIAVYGAAPLPFTEKTRSSPEDPYGIAKLAVEQDLHAAARHFGLRSIIFRPHNIYGERQNLSDPYRNVIGIFMRQVLAGEPCTVFGDGSQTRAFSYVEDVAPLIARSVYVPAAVGKVFNIGADRQYRVDRIAEMVQYALGRRTGIRCLDQRNEVAHAYCSHARLREVFGPAETISIEEGISRMAAWAQNTEIAPPRWSPDVEIAKNMPASWARIATGTARAAGGR